MAPQPTFAREHFNIIIKEHVLHISYGAEPGTVYTEFMRITLHKYPVKT